MCFGWYQELLRETSVPDLATAETTLLEMLDDDGMIVHVYRETEMEKPELVGRHERLRAFIGAEGRRGHEVERYLLDAACLGQWIQANRTGGVLEQRWSIVDLWPTEEQEEAWMYGRATLTAREPGSGVCAASPHT